MAIGLSFGRKWKVRLGVFAVALLVTVGVFAANDWFPKTDALTGAKTGWFGKKLPKNTTASAWNPFPPPSPTPQLSKEYIYAGSRLLAVEDANAVAAPPADIAVWRGSNGNWMIQGQTGSATTTFGFGGGWLGDIPLVGDYDGDGKTDFTVWRPGTTQAVFYVWPSGPTSWYGYSWGLPTDIPVVGDFEGDGKTDYVVARPESGLGALHFYVLKSSDLNYYLVNWGTHTDKPAVADYDGDGKSDIAVFRQSEETFYIIRSSDGGQYSVDVGYDGTIVSSDYDGDGKADPAIYVPSTATWYVHQSTTGTTVSQVWGNNGTSGCTGSCSALVPVQNDYDLDGKTDFAVWDNASSAVWTIRRSSNGTTRTETFGTTGDIPVPAFYRR